MVLPKLPMEAIGSMDTWKNASNCLNQPCHPDMLSAGCSAGQGLNGTACQACVGDTHSTGGPAAACTACAPGSLPNAAKTACVPGEPQVTSQGGAAHLMACRIPACPITAGTAYGWPRQTPAALRWQSSGRRSPMQLRLRFGQGAPSCRCSCSRWPAPPLACCAVVFVSGKTYADANFDRVHGAGEVGLPQVLVTLQSVVRSVRTTVTTTRTATDGTYSLPIRTAGTYAIAFGTPTGYTRTTAAPAPFAVTIPGPGRANVNAGFYRAGEAGECVVGLGRPPPGGGGLLPRQHTRAAVDLVAGCCWVAEAAVLCCRGMHVSWQPALLPTPMHARPIFPPPPPPRAPKACKLTFMVPPAP